MTRRQRLERLFKLAMGAATLIAVAVPLVATSPGRYLAGWLTAQGRSLALKAVGGGPRRDEIDAQWRRRREFDMASARARHAAAFGDYNDDQRRLLRFAGMDPGRALLRWGNYDRTVMLPATVFDADDSGRSYRLRPNVRSVWVRNFPTRGNVKAYFPVPDLPEAARLAEKAGAAIVEGSSQTTNSWGLRGPEPDLSAPFRGIALGDSYLQGIFVGDDETPVEQLKRAMSKRFGGAVEILNTGHLGYSPEQYYYSLLEYARRFPPQFVVVSVFANDFAGDLEAVLEGTAGDWEEGAYWLGKIRDFCFARGLPFLYVAAPWANQVDGLLKSGFYPGRVSNALETSGFYFLDPIGDFANTLLELEIHHLRRGEPIQGDPLFLGRIGDAHFSAQGCAVWAEAVGERMCLLILRRMAELGKLPALAPEAAPR